MFKIFTEERQISYLEVDKNNKLKNSAIINIMQDVAGDHSESLHIGLNDKERTGTAWILLNWKLEIVGRPKYKDILTINTWPRKMDRYFSYRDFEIFCNGELVAKAESKWVLVSAITGTITKISDEFIKKYEINEKSVFEEEIEEKKHEPANTELTYEVAIGRTQIDTNNHLNNVYYLDFAIESLPEAVYENEELNNIEIMYKKATMYKENLKCFYGKENERHIVVIKDIEENIRAIVKMW